MGTLSHVVACTDLSSPARHAVERAALVAAASGAQLDVVCVSAVAWMDRAHAVLQGKGDELAERVHAAVQQQVDELAQHLGQRHGIQVRSSVLKGAVIPALCAHARVAQADLIVLGARGAGFLRHALLGSTAERLIRAADSPILIVKQLPHAPYRRALMALDLSEQALRVIRATQAVAVGAKLMPMHAFESIYESKLRLAGVDEATIGHYRDAARNEATVRLGETLRASGLENHGALLLLHGDAVTCILEQTQELDCDLVVIGRQGEGPLEEVLAGSVTRHVLNGSQGDVLVAC